MAENKVSTTQRIVKVPLPIALIRRMDESIVAERGGFRTRAELIKEAIENLLHETEYLESEEVERRVEPPRSESMTTAFDLPDWEIGELSVKDLAGTAIRLSSKPYLMEDGAAQAPHGPLLGLHNRDYVSIWALERLARYSTNAPVPVSEYFDKVTRAAWFFGAQLKSIERQGEGAKLSILFPTNVNKRPSAERGFQAFAIGTIGRSDTDGNIPTSGPLFAWHTVQVQAGARSVIGVTPAGFRLLRDLEGLSLDLPHSETHTSAFLTYLAEHAPDDLSGLDRLLAVVAYSPDRNSLVRSFSELNASWSTATASSVAQGYIARAREWGLIEQKLVEGRYWLSQRGRERLKHSESETNHPTERSNPNA